MSKYKTKMRTLRLFYNHGTSLVETLVALAIVLTIAGAITTILIDMQKEHESVVSKLESSSIHSSIQSLLIRREDCDCQVKGKIFDSKNTNAEIDLKEITMSCAPNAATLVSVSANPGSDPDSVTVARIFLGDVVATGNSNEFVSDLYIQSQRSKGQRQIKKTKTPLRFYTDPTTPASAKVIVGCGAVPLTTPTGLQAVPGAGQCTLSWTESAGAVPISYTVKRSTVPDPDWNSITQDGCRQTLDTSCSTSTIDPPLVDGTTYYFAVQASNPDGSSGWSNVASCRPTAPPGIPVLSSASGNKKCTITWPVVSGTAPIAYTVYQNGAAIGGCTDISQTSCLITGLINGTTYNYTATAKNEVGTSPLSGVVSCTPTSYCTGTISLQYPATNPCRKGRRTGTYSATISNIIDPEGAIAQYYVTGNIRVRKQANCGPVYCPIRVTCLNGTFTSTQAAACTWGAGPGTGGFHSNLPNNFWNGGDSLNGWYNMRLYSQ